VEKFVVEGQTTIKERPYTRNWTKSIYLWAWELGQGIKCEPVDSLWIKLERVFTEDLVISYGSNYINGTLRENCQFGLLILVFQRTNPIDRVRKKPMAPKMVLGAALSILMPVSGLQTRFHKVARQWRYIIHQRVRGSRFQTSISKEWRRWGSGACSGVSLSFGPLWHEFSALEVVFLPATSH